MAVMREHYQLPTVEEITSRLVKAQYFTVLDASSGFWQLKLDEASSRLCTFKGLVHPKMKIKSLITHPHAVPTP